MNNRSVSTETFLELLKLGFTNYECLLDKWCKVSHKPTHAMVQSWFREKYNIHITWDETFTYALTTHVGFYAKVFKPIDEELIIIYYGNYFCSTPEEAIEEGIENIIKFINTVPS